MSTNPTIGKADHAMNYWADASQVVESLWTTTRHSRRKSSQLRRLTWWVGRQKWAVAIVPDDGTAWVQVGEPLVLNGRRYMPSMNHEGAPIWADLDAREALERGDVPPGAATQAAERRA